MNKWILAIVLIAIGLFLALHESNSVITDGYDSVISYGYHSASDITSCPKCGGSGKTVISLKCWTCAGTGKSIYTGKICTACSGSGYTAQEISCPDCGGDGLIGNETVSQPATTYSAIDSDAGIQSNWNTRQKCTICGGTGIVQCTSCGGTGYLEKTQYAPNFGVGTGNSLYTTQTRCSLCNGSGRMNCIYCHGTGIL